MIHKNRVKNFYWYTFAVLIFFSAAPANAMMGRLRASVVRAYQSMQNLRQATGPAQSPRTAQYLNLFTRNSPSFNTQAHLPAIATASQRSEKPAAGFFLLPIVAASVVATVNEWIKDRPYKHLFDDLTDSSCLLSYSAFSAETIQAEDFKHLYNRMLAMGKHLSLKDKQRLTENFLRYWASTKLIKKEMFDQECEDVTTLLLSFSLKDCAEHTEKITSWIGSHGFSKERSTPPVLQFIKRIATHILEKELSMPASIKRILSQLPDNDRNELLIAFYKNMPNPFNIEDAQDGPLFQNYFAQHELQERAINESTINFNALLPEIVEYVNEEYKQKRIVLFHGQSSEWIFLEKIFRLLYSLKNGTCPSETFTHTRFQEHSELLQEDIILLRENGIYSRTMYNNYRFKILFTNLHPFANQIGSNTWYYVTNNHDVSTSTRRFDFKAALKNMFESLGMTAEYEQLTTQNPKLFEELKILLDKANKEQGGFGNLLTISMPQEFAETHIYSTTSGGPMQTITINGTNTTSVVDASQNFKQVPEQNEWALLLSEEIVNPQTAEKAGVKIVGFNPVSYWRTSKYLAFEAKLQEMIELVKNMRAKKSQKNGEQS